MESLDSATLLTPRIGPCLLTQDSRVPDWVGRISASPSEGEEEASRAAKRAAKAARAKEREEFEKEKAKLARDSRVAQRAIRNA